MVRLCIVGDANLENKAVVFAHIKMAIDEMWRKNMTDRVIEIVRDYSDSPASKISREFVDTYRNILDDIRFDVRDVVVADPEAFVKSDKTVDYQVVRVVPPRMHWI